MRVPRNFLVGTLVLLSALSDVHAASDKMRIIEIRQRNPDGEIEATTCEAGAVVDDPCHLIIKIISKDQHQPENIIAEIESTRSMVDIKFRSKGALPLSNGSGLRIEIDKSGRARESLKISRPNPLDSSGIKQSLVLRGPGDSVAELEVTILPSQ